MTATEIKRTITLVPVRRPAGKVQVNLSPKEPGEMFKDRADWLLEGLNASYSRRMGYCLSPRRAEMFVKLYEAGFWASRRLLASSGPATFSLAQGPEMTLKEALAACETPKQTEPELVECNVFIPSDEVLICYQCGRTREKHS